MEKPADTEYPVLDVIKRRWSPYVFADRPVEREKIMSLLEAARWSASSYNEQPWRFIIATKGDHDAFEKALGCLVEANQAWAKDVPLLIIGVTRTTFSRNDKPNRVHQHDLGLAAQNISLQATELGLFVHQMAGINASKVRSEYGIPDGFEPQTAIAIGYGVDESDLSDEMRDKETSPRSRKNFGEFVFGTSWDEASPIVR